MKNLKAYAVASVATLATLASANVLAASEQALAKQLATHLQNSENLQSTMKMVSKSQLPVLIDSVLPQTQSRLSIPGKKDATEIWLHMPDSRALGGDLSDLVVAFPPQGEESSWNEVVGYDLKGGTVSMNVDVAPDFPVIVVEDSGYHAMQAGIAQLNKMLQASGLQSEFATQSAGFDAKKLTKIRLKDDEEPWVKGAAEIYGLVTGVLQNNSPQVVAVDMPYLDHDDTTYYPNQIVINWSEYNYQVVDMLLYEADGNTNYKELVKALISAVGAAGSLAGWAPATAIAEITNRVIDATPSSWYTDDDDFVDACYTIEKFKTMNDVNCAGGNAKVSMSPFYVQSN